MTAAREAEALRLEAVIQTRARDFEVPALLRALRAAGYRDEQIALRSNPSLGFSASLIESVEFTESGEFAELGEPGKGEDAPVRHAVVTMNRGLLSNQGPLPSYFWELLAEQRESLMLQFLWFFDERLLHAYYLTREPERNGLRGYGLERVLSDLLRLLRLCSPHGLHWLFQTVFPELDVHVRRAPSERRLEVTRVQMTRSELGAGSALLGYAQVPSGGMIVTLFADESRTSQGRLWGEAAAERMQRRILPQLQGMDLCLTVICCIREHFEHLSLSSDAHLAYGVLFAAEDECPRAPVHRIVVYSGVVGAASGVQSGGARAQGVRHDGPAQDQL